MSVLSDLKNNILKKESINSNTKTNKILLNRFSFNNKGKRINYAQSLKILEDTTVKMSYDMLKYLLSSKQWILLANDEDDQGVFEFVNSMLFNLNTEVNEVVRNLTTALLYGFSCQEILFEISEEGKVIVKDILPLHIKTLQHDPFVYNDDGELIAVHQEYNNDTVDIPINKVLKYSYGEFNEDYGYGILNEVKLIVEDKINILNWLMTFGEKHSLPALVGKTDDPRSRDAMLSAFEDMRDGTLGMTIGLNDEVSVLESNHHGETFFNSLEYFDNQIVKKFFIGDLIAGTINTTGSYARSSTQLDFSELVYDGILEEIANCIQKQIINPIVEFNYGNIDYAPTFQFDKFTHGDLHALLATLKPLIDSGVVDSENTTVQDSIGLLFKQETGLNYTSDEIVETEFEQEPEIDETEDTQAILEDLMTYE